MSTVSGSLTVVRGRKGAAVDKIELFFSDGTSKTYGGDGGHRTGEFRLRPGETLVKVEHQQDGPCGSGVVQVLLRKGAAGYLGHGFRFHSSSGRVHEIAGDGRGPWTTHEVPAGQQFRGLRFEGEDALHPGKFQGLITAAVARPSLSRAATLSNMHKPSAKPPSQLLIALAGAATALMHALPIGIVQFADYASDVGVVKTFFESDDEASGWIGAGFIIASIAVVWIATFAVCIVICCSSRSTSASERQMIKLSVGSALLAPLNMHTLFLAVMLARSQARLKTLASRSSVSPEQWQAWDAAQLALSEAYRSGDRMRIKAAIAALDKARRAIDYKVYFEELDYCELANMLFVLSKAVETALEAMPLSVLTASALFADSLPESFGLFASSLGLSLLSMACIPAWIPNPDQQMIAHFATHAFGPCLGADGLFGGCCMLHDQWKGDADINPTKGRQGQIFVCILISTPI